MKTLILTLALVVSTTLSFSQNVKETSKETQAPESRDVEVAVLQSSQDILNLHLEKKAGDLVMIKVFEDEDLLYKRRVKKAASANITYDISSFPDGEYTIRVEKDKNVVYSKKIKRGETKLAGNN